MLDIENFEEYAQKITQFVLDYYKNIESFPVKSIVEPGDIFHKIPNEPPIEAESFDQILDDFNKIILPGITHWQHPRFFAYFPANTSFPSILAEYLVSALGVQAMIWQTSPASTELEEKMMIWLRKLLGISEDFNGVIQDTASTSTLVALLTAREKFSNFSINNQGFRGEKFVVYCSTEAHSSIEKAVKIVGIGANNLRKIPVDDTDFSMRCELLEKQIRNDIKLGFKPLCVVGALGTTGSMAIDPLIEIGEIAKKYDLWYHIDGAMAGSALILDEFSKLREGVNLADTFVFNPHKWLFTNFDCSAFYIKDKDTLLKTFEIYPEYLKTDLDRRVNNYRDWGIQLGRRFRSLKLWFVIRSFGIKGLKKIIRSHLDMAKELSELIEKEEIFEILAPVNFTTICFRYRPRKEDSEGNLEILNKKLLAKINESGFAYLTHTKLNGKFAIRFSIGQTNTKFAHVFETWEFIKSIAKQLN
ncbi:MAG: pyridoxal-dependent decarboxylase [Ignavibacteria bacterium]|nr:pyridoxal-dependent decarboxylase [Ignavibacteria bacterium]